MSQKSEALSCSINFQVKFERKFDCKVKTVYSDNGGEYLGLVEYLNK